MDNEILDQPFDEEKNETGFLQSSTGMNPRIIGSARLAILMFGGFAVFVFWKSMSQCFGPNLLEEIGWLLLFGFLILTSLYYVPQSFFESKRRLKMFAKNRFRKISLPLPISIIVFTIYLTSANLKAINPLIAVLVFGLIFMCGIVIYRDIHYIRLNKKQSKP